MPVEADIPSYIVGETVLREATFRDDDNALYNPATVTFSYKDPNDTITAGTVNNVSTGIFKCEFEAGIAGRWVYEWLTTGGASRKGGEFDVLGSMLSEPSRGIVGRAVASIMPLTWDNLKESPIYGEAQLSRRIQMVKHRILGTVMGDADESSYSLLLVDYVSKCVALDLIPTAIEFWMRQKITITTTGTSETTAFTDPIPALKELQRKLTVDVAQLAGNPDIIALSTTRSDAPAISGNDDNTFVTENPFDFLPGFVDAS